LRIQDDDVKATEKFASQGIDGVWRWKDDVDNKLIRGSIGKSFTATSVLESWSPRFHTNHSILKSIAWLEFILQSF
jgi:hypothetical protein